MTHDKKINSRASSLPSCLVVKSKSCRYHGRYSGQGVLVFPPHPDPPRSLSRSSRSVPPVFLFEKRQFFLKAGVSNGVSQFKVVLTISKLLRPSAVIKTHWSPRTVSPLEARQSRYNASWTGHSTFHQRQANQLMGNYRFGGPQSTEASEGLSKSKD